MMNLVLTFLVVAVIGIFVGTLITEVIDNHKRGIYNKINNSEIH
jgi:hypothetical protein